MKDNVVISTPNFWNAMPEKQNMESNIVQNGLNYIKYLLQRSIKKSFCQAASKSISPSSIKKNFAKQHQKEFCQAASKSKTPSSIYKKRNAASKGPRNAASITDIDPTGSISWDLQVIPAAWYPSVKLSGR